MYDPTVDEGPKWNWILSFTEGYIEKGLMNGFNRVINACNGHTKYGYFKKGDPFGKCKIYD